MFVHNGLIIYRQKCFIHALFFHFSPLITNFSVTYKCQMKLMSHYVSVFFTFLTTSVSFLPKHSVSFADVLGKIPNDKQSFKLLCTCANRKYTGQGPLKLFVQNKDPCLQSNRLYCNMILHKQFICFNSCGE